MRKSKFYLLIILPLLLASCGKDEEEPNYKVDDPWKQMVLSNYNEFLNEINSKSNLIPLIVSTDQHGTISADSEVFTYINQIVDFTKISKIISLGDTVSGTYNKQELDNYKVATSCLPANKRIEVVGNHDRSGNPDNTVLEEHFNSLGRDNSGFNYTYSVTDSLFGVKYLLIDCKDHYLGYQNGYLESAKADYIINQLSSTSTEDIIILSHPYIFRDNLKTRDNKTFTGSDYFIGGPEVDVNVKTSFVTMLENRKNKASGTLLDSEGGSHPYDFSASGGKLLMSLHGHHHTEGYETSNGFTEFLFQSMREDEVMKLKEPNCFYFAYIDRTNNKFKCWKNVKNYSSWEITIA